ncbi:MAG: tRNA pseudouridine(55) synthase TruB [Chloroflexi bacterium]|nr:tRNA pseudouridine(55) synthase TruB [Chloroflexota bacterium]
MLNGFINANKPSGISSNKLLNLIKHDIGGSKIGFVGTLDPLASGVLPICIGFATRLSDMISEPVKEYIFTGNFGAETDTCDIEGKIICESKYDHVEEKNLDIFLKKLKKSYNQEAPIYSALKVKGKKMYELARQGIEVKPKVRKVKLIDFEIIDFEKPTFKIKILCSKGFYVRSLVRDIGRNLGTHAYLTSLLRTKSSGFDIKDSFSTDQIKYHIDNGSVKNLITPIEKLLVNFKLVNLNKFESMKILNGNNLRKSMFNVKNNDKLIIFDDNSSIISIGEYIDDVIFPLKVVAHD